MFLASGRPSMGGSGSGGRDRFNSTNRDDGQSETGVSFNVGLPMVTFVSTRLDNAMFAYLLYTF